MLRNAKKEAHETPHEMTSIFMRRNISEPVWLSFFIACIFQQFSSVQSSFYAIIIVMKHQQQERSRERGTYVDASVNYRDWLITTSNIYFSFADARRRQGNSSVTNFVRFLAKKGLKNNPFYF